MGKPFDVHFEGTFEENANFVRPLHPFNEFTILGPQRTPAVDGNQVGLHSDGIQTPLTAPANHLHTMIVHMALARLKIEVVNA